MCIAMRFVECIAPSGKNPSSCWVAAVPFEVLYCFWKKGAGREREAVERSEAW